MAQSLAKIFVHLIFSTKKHKPFIVDDVNGELYAYIGGVLKNNGCVPVEINGTVDHIHILFCLSKTITTSDIVREVKTASSKWVKERFSEQDDFGWQNGYAVFSVSQSAVEQVKAYIRNQKQHHEEISFKDELVRFLEKHKVDYNPEYIWD